MRNAVTLVWGSLRLAPIKSQSEVYPHIGNNVYFHPSWALCTN